MININKTKSFSSIALIFILLLVILSYIVSIVRTKRMRNNHIVLCGRVLEMRAGKGVNVIFDYTYEGKLYTQNTASPTITYENYKKGDYNVLVVIDKENPHIFEILTESSQYEDLNITEKDTLNIKCN